MNLNTATHSSALLKQSVQKLPLPGIWPSFEPLQIVSAETKPAQANGKINGQPSSNQTSAASNFNSPTLEQSFIAGPENELLVEAGHALCDTLGASYNPLLICGAPGLGKSHFARGLATYWQQKAKAPKSDASNPLPLVFSGAEFLAAWNAANDQSRVRVFQSRLRSCPLLVIDDLTQLANKRTALRELQNSTDELTANGGQLIVTSRLPIEMIHGISAALIGRLTCGLVVEIHPPEVATRQEFWQRYAEKQGVSIEPDVLQTLATGLKIAPVEIWQTVAELAAKSASGNEITLQEAKSLLARQRSAYRPNIRTIASLCAKYYSLKPADLASPVRRRTNVTARNMSIYLARTMANVSLEQLGKHFGGRDHTTVLHGFRSMEERLRTEPELKQAYDDLRKMLAQR